MVNNMKKTKLFYLPLIAVSLIISGCSNPVEEEPTLDDVTFHEDTSEEDPVPRDIDLPTIGSDAVTPLEISATTEYYNNVDLHQFAGQWGGYGIHYPSLLKYGNKYYLYSSTPDMNVGIKAYSSEDLVNWAFVGTMGYVTKDKASFAAKAPQVFHVDDNFLMYFKSSSGYNIFKSSSPEGPFVPFDKVEFDSNYIGNFYLAPNGKMFYIAGGDEVASIYEMSDYKTIDGNSKYDIVATKIDSYNGASNKITNPSISYVNQVAYLTYSSQDEKVASYRSYYATAIAPDFSSSESLAKSFFSNKQGPVLINTNSLHGSVGLGDLKIIEGPDNASYFAYYTSLESTSVRRFNVSPIYLEKGYMSLSHRDNNSIKPNSFTAEVPEFSDEVVLSDEVSESHYVASLTFKDMKEVYFSYHTSKNTFVVEFKDNKANLILRENGLNKLIASRDVSGKNHEVIAIAHDDVDVYLDGYLMAENYKTSFDLKGKIGYLVKDENSRKIAMNFTNVNIYKDNQFLFKQADQPFSAAQYLEEDSKVSAETKIKLIEDKNNDFYGYPYLDLSTARDYARYLVDVNEDARYGIELVLNTSFTYYEAALGIRLGLNNELIYKTSQVGLDGYCRILTAEFDMSKGPAELLIENLSNAYLRLVSVRLVKTSKYYPSYENSLSTYVESGVHYETDFRINSSFGAHETYEGARSFAYVGDNTITDFKLSVQVGKGYLSKFSVLYRSCFPPRLG